mgnify:CR=1 FL=1
MPAISINSWFGVLAPAATMLSRKEMIPAPGAMTSGFCTPSMRGPRALNLATAPTVSPLYATAALHGVKWFSIESVIAEATVRDLIPQLLRVGAVGIIEYPLNKIVL